MGRFSSDGMATHYELERSLRNVEEYGRFCLLCGIPITYYVVVSVFSAVKLDREANRRKKIR